LVKIFKEVDADVYPGGMQMPGRKYLANNNSKYRFGFNSHEKSDEIAGEGNHTTALFGEYDTRLVRRWNLDPRPDISASPYSMFSNNPIWFNDIALDTARNAGNGQLGQQFTFAAAPGSGISAAQLAQLSTRFQNSLTNTINNGGNTFGGNVVNLNTSDAQAPVIAVTFGNFGVSTSNGNSINMDIGELNSPGNAAAHEWLHTAGLMDRYYELYGRALTDNKDNPVVDGQRTGTVPMGALPPGHDPQHDASTNIMSNSANTGVTAMQWGIVFNFQSSGISEESLGTLGKVSFIYNFGFANHAPYMVNNRRDALSSLKRKLSQNTNNIAFSSTSAFNNRGGTFLQVPNEKQFGLLPANLNSYMIHNRSGNIFGYDLGPNSPNNDTDRNQLSKTINR
jgi:hypothetical protein